MRKRVVLLLTLLVATALLASGCFGRGPIVDDPELVAVDAVVNQLIDALSDPDGGEIVAGLLASGFKAKIGIDWIETEDGDEDGFLDGEEFLAVCADPQLTWSFVAWKDPEDVDRGIIPIGLQMIGSPSTRIPSQSLATSDLSVMLTLGHPEDRFDDTWMFRSSAAYSVEDIYQVDLELQKIESDWKVTYLEIDAGERQTAIKTAWDTFIAVFEATSAEPDTYSPEEIEEFIDTALSVCTDPFNWSFAFVPSTSTHYEWRELFRHAFYEPGPWGYLDWSVPCMTPMTLDGEFAAFYIGPRAGSDASYVGDNGEGDSSLVNPFTLELQVVNRDGIWLLSAMFWKLRGLV